MKTVTKNISPEIPEHVAIIMDGNGRWARKRGLPRSLGHKKGAETAKNVVKSASELGIQYLTLFGFSSENWNRPKDEIKELMKLLRQYLQSQTAEFHENNARLCVIGDRSAFEPDIVKLINNAERLTKDNDGIHVIIALNYGGRRDIAQAAHTLAKEAAETQNVPDIDHIEEALGGALWSAHIPDPDLLIRTSGEQRISNFLLWQCAYTELFFTQTLWPDFDKIDLQEALQAYAERDRRYGALKEAN